MIFSLFPLTPVNRKVAFMSKLFQNVIFDEEPVSKMINFWKRQGTASAVPQNARKNRGFSP